MPGTLVRFGPWPGGLNNRDVNVAADLVNPAELRFVLNLDVTDSGALNARLGCRKAGSTAMYTDISVSGTFALVGSVDAGGKRYAVVSPHNGSSPGTSTFYYTVNPQDAAAGWTAVPSGSSTGKFASLFNYGGFVYVVGAPSGGATGQRRADITAGTWTAVAALPSGDLSFVVRDRAFVVDKNLNRIYWSKVTDPTTWAAPDGGFTDIDPGLGGPITDVAVVNSQIYIFKRNRTSLFTFTTDPATDGQITLLNGQLGAYSTALWTNSIYLVNDRSVYRLLNNFFTDIGTKLDPVHALSLDVVGAPGTVVAVENDRLVVGPVTGGGTIFTHASVNLHTGAWSLRRYEKGDGTGASVVGPSTMSITWRDSTTGASTGGTGNLYGHGKRIISFTRTLYGFGDAQGTLDRDDNDRAVSPEYSLNTMEWTGGDFETWKRMYWAGVRVINGLPGTDNTVHTKVAVGPDVSSFVQDVVVPATPVTPTAFGGKVALTSFRFRSVVWQLVKAMKDLGAASGFDPNTSSSLVVHDILSRVGSYGAEVSTL